ncbi:DUF541 domain-containing protein [Altericroceibacterium spongiae]|uniref:DUF541 domain-containing protein n=1 Tax=Altericroceibacterium spongiae TaxID=2320269 RepID=A0A420EKK0_9SPHN|nr:SIMPL domain-containing protein [Altericroceibacterium spongiae]RKF21180.1 DUF541 domain-containing protein [Altericroceibacterium spongiae]
MIRYALPLLAASAIASPAIAAEVHLQATGPVIELNVNERVKAEPDIVNMSAGVTTEAQTAVEAMQANAKQMNAVIKRITALGIEDRDVQTSGINLSARYDYDQQTRKQIFRGYQASNRVNITLRDIDEVGPTLDALVAAGATDLNGPNWSLDNDENVKAEARRKALDSAKKQAMEYAQWAGYSNIRLLEVSEAISRSQPIMSDRMMAVAAPQAESTPIKPGMVETGVTVAVKYEMTN